ncbi:hypothetical protein Sjap_000702 [Stephania japonica]|uniref:Phytochrome n=1 Tax=Stephania japonica TaxID=461633 RepID=A0AAP0KIM1_9MAGN
MFLRRLAQPLLAKASEPQGALNQRAVSNTREVLISLYTNTLHQIKSIPEHEAHRDTVETFTTHRLKVCEEEHDCDAIERRLGCGRVEKLIEDARLEAEQQAGKHKRGVHVINRAVHSGREAPRGVRAVRELGPPFNYSKSVTTPPESVSEDQIRAYLSKIQRGGHVQPFGCTVALEEPSFRIIAHSENSSDLLSLPTTPSPKPLLGLDARELFTRSSAEALTKATSSTDISLLNPILVHSSHSQSPFYAALHRVDVGLVVDLEPARLGDPAFAVAGPMHSQKLAVQAITRLQSVPPGDIDVLCDTLVEDIQELTGYDRVMVYKFHEEDDHGEVVSEVRRFDLEAYLGLHYPATDIPQAARFLFMQNRIRMIYDCNAAQVRVLQSEDLDQPLSLVNSTLRSPHDCHAEFMRNMGSTASLVMAIVKNGNDSTTKLWGLVACHHCSPKCVPFPLRCACEFLIRAFGLQLKMELQLAAHLIEKKIVKMQASLCEMMLKDGQVGVVNQSPNIMELVNCDGAALYLEGRCHLLGVTPSETQIKEIANWLLTHFQDSTGLTTDSLDEAGFPGAPLLGDTVCGLASAKISSTDFLFWFRSHVAKEVKWGGARHHVHDRDDAGTMHPRTSFKVFLEVVKHRSLPWEIWEMNAIHALQLMIRDIVPNVADTGATTEVYDQSGNFEMAQLNLVAGELVRMIETASTPIFAVDSDGLINAWNVKSAELTGLVANEAMGKSLVGDIVDEQSRATVENLLSQALKDEEHANVEFRLKTFDSKQGSGAVSIVANTCASKDKTNSIVGVCFVGQDVTEQKILLDKFVRLQGDYKAIIQSLNPLVPPIFAADENACCSEWNAAMEEQTGWTREEVIGKLLPGGIFGNLCRLKGQDGVSRFMILLYQTLCDQDTEKSPFSFFDRKGKYMEFLITATKRTDMQGNVSGCFCFLQPALEIKMQDTAKSFSRLRHLAYIQQELKAPLQGIKSLRKDLETTISSESSELKQLLETSDACERQMLRIIGDTELGTMEAGGSFKINMGQFLLRNVMISVISQVMDPAREKNIQIIQKIPQEIRGISLYGDQIRLQQVLADFLLHSVYYAPSNGWVEINATTFQNQFRMKLSPCPCI